jgi:hypothetical protein
MDFEERVEHDFIVVGSGAGTNSACPEATAYSYLQPQQ